MERCTDNRSTTPPLNIKIKSKENGKQIASSSSNAKENLVDIPRSKLKSSITDDTLHVSPISRSSKSSGLCDYDLSSEEDGEVSESNSKSVSGRCESTKSSVINVKNRKSEERDRKYRRDRRRSRNSSPRRKSKDRKSSSHQNKDYHDRRRDSRPKQWNSIPKDLSKEPIKNREMRRTLTEPVIEYCENGRYSSFNSRKQLSTEPKSKVRRTNNVANTVNVVQTYDEDEEEETTTSGQHTPKKATEQCSTFLNVKSKSPEIANETSPSKIKQSIDDCSSFKSSVNNKELITCKNEPEDMFNCGEDNLLSNSHEPVNIEQSPNQTQPNECETELTNKNSSTMAESSDDNMNVTSTTQEPPKTPPITNKKPNDSKILSEDKLKQYIDEYDSFIQQVSSPLRENDTNESIIATTECVSSAIVEQISQNDKEPLKNEVTSTSSTQKIDENVDKHSSSSTSSDEADSSSSSGSSTSSSTSSDDSSSSDDDSSSSSDSSSSTENDSNDDKSNRQKSSSKRSSSRSASKSPRLRPSKTNNFLLPELPHLDADGFDVGTEKPYANGIETIMKPLGLNLAALDKLIDLNDDDEDLFRNLESYKLHVQQKKLAKEKPKTDETNDNDSIRNYENGALLHESERKKVSLILKPTTNLKQQTKEVSNSFVDIEQQESNQTSNEKQTTVEPNDQIEKRPSDSSNSMTSAKKKSSHRKDERKSRRSEERKSRHNEEKSRSRWNEDRRSRRHEEKKDVKRSKRSEERRSRRSEERHSKRSEERRSRRSEEKRRSEERRSKRRHDRSPNSPGHYREPTYYSPSYRNRSMSPLPRGPRTPPNTPPPNATDCDEIAVRSMPPYGTAVIPPQAHYIPGPNQFPTPNLPSNVPNYMNEYAAYMHPNRVPVPQQYNRPPPTIHATPAGMPSVGPNSEYYYNNSSPLAATHHHQLQSQGVPSNSYSNLIEVAPFGALDSSNVDCIRKQSENRRKSTIAVQKGNVLEIVPSAELQCDKNIDAMEMDTSDKNHLLDKQQQQTLQWQKQERIKRKMERNHKRMLRARRREYLLAELGRLSHLMTVGEDGKIVKASEILKQLEWDGTSIKLANSKEIGENDEQEDIYIEPTIYTYDPYAKTGKGILSDRNGSDRSSTLKDSVKKRRGVLFADGVAPGDGTSASEGSANEDDDNNTKPKTLSVRAKTKKNAKNISLPVFSNELPIMFPEKDNLLDTKFNQKDVKEQEIIPPAPPGSPPAHLPQPKLKDPEKHLPQHLLYFHYDLRLNEMIITPNHHLDHMVPPMMIPPPVAPVIQSIPPPIQQIQPIPSYPHKSSRHHSDSKLSKSSRSSSSKHYHSSSHKHATSDMNLISLSNSPSNNG